MKGKKLKVVDNDWDASTYDFALMSSSARANVSTLTAVGKKTWDIGLPATALPRADLRVGIVMHASSKRSVNMTIAMFSKGLGLTVNGRG